MKKDGGNCRGASRAKTSPSLLRARNYHGRTLNIRVVSDTMGLFGRKEKTTSETMFFRASVRHADGLLTIETPSGNTGSILLHTIKAVSRQEVDGIMVLTLCNSESKDVQASIGTNILVPTKTNKRGINLTALVSILDAEEF
jgi:hypothetical protein